MGASNGAALRDVGQKLCPVLQIWPPQDRAKVRIISILPNATTLVACGQPVVNHWSTIGQLLFSHCSTADQLLVNKDT